MKRKCDKCKKVEPKVYYKTLQLCHGCYDKMKWKDSHPIPNYKMLSESFPASIKANVRNTHAPIKLPVWLNEENKRILKRRIELNRIHDKVKKEVKS